ncbi:MAG TPA: DinB family protein [Ignavibacteria bacterium]|nr:DinB family protein [Ignavibacteria bacterium]
MYTSIDQFQKDWKYESDATLKVLDNLTDESLKQKITPDGRSLGFLAWHLIHTIPEMMGKTGLKIEGPTENSEIPKSATEIKDTYKNTSNFFSELVNRSWKDETLNIEDDLYGERWKRGITLSALILHQAHHRGQMTVLMRQAGLKVPGIYGPSKEEWEAMGMKPLD